MRILLASSSSGSRGGGELFLAALGEELKRRRHEILFWTSTDARMDELAHRFNSFAQVLRSDYRNTYSRRFRSLSAFLDAKTAAQISREWLALTPDVIHLNKQNLEDGLDLMAAARNTALPRVCTVHITQSARSLRARSAWVRDLVAYRGLRRFGGPVSAVSEERQKSLEAFLGNTNGGRAIVNGVQIPSLQELERDRAAMRAQLQIKNGEILLLAVGRMVEQKRPLLFLKLADTIRQKLPHVKFCWIGDGRLRTEWERTAASLRFDDRLLTMSWLANPNPYYAAADAFLHTAEYEGLPLAVLEAMAAGLPCFLTSNLAEQFGWRDTPGVVSIDQKDLTWISRLSDSENRKKLGEAARIRASNEFSLSRMADDYLKLYRLAIEGRK
jgi:glycosyltransferase involved in cell wall biosynthesis